MGYTDVTESRQGSVFFRKVPDLTLEVSFPQVWGVSYLSLHLLWWLWKQKTFSLTKWPILCCLQQVFLDRWGFCIYANHKEAQAGEKIVSFHSWVSKDLQSKAFPCKKPERSLKIVLMSPHGKCLLSVFRCLPLPQLSFCCHSPQVDKLN